MLIFLELSACFDNIICGIFLTCLKQMMFWGTDSVSLLFPKRFVSEDGAEKCLFNPMTLFFFFNLGAVLRSLFIVIVMIIFYYLFCVLPFISHCMCVLRKAGKNNKNNCSSLFIRRRP